MSFVKYSAPCKTKDTNDDFKAHVARGSSIPGLDYNCPTGTKVFACADGEVIVTDEVAKDGTGISIEIKHPDGMHTRYLHLSKIQVKKGQKVSRGDTIALSGATGTTVTGAHLHLSVVDKHGKFIDPDKWFAKNKKEEKDLAAAATPEAAAPVVES
jgi:murein DD-endopeptidase MepM/ murein hydrolase activator NlpD